METLLNYQKGILRKETTLWMVAAHKMNYDHDLRTGSWAPPQGIPKAKETQWSQSSAEKSVKLPLCLQIFNLSQNTIFSCKT